MASRDELQNSRAKVIAAAEATARWARARRATWSDAPLPPALTEPAPIETAPIEPAPIEPAAPIAFAPPPVVVAAQPPERTGETREPAAARRGVRVRIPVRAISKFLALAAAGAAVVTVGVLFGPDLRSRVGNLTTARPAPSRGSTPLPAQSGLPNKTTGELRVSSSPAGAQVRIDGKPRGVTPLTVTDLSAGTHAVEIESASGTVRRSIAIVAGETAEISEAIFSGWLAVYAPFELSITEGKRALRLDDRNQVMLPPGPHDLILANRNFGFEEKRHVELKPGETTTISVAPARSTIAITASETAQVSIDGAPAGETPLAALPIDLGTHQVVVRPASGRERRFTVTITAKPFSLNVDFSAPG